jgi:cytidyltransferase-like protein
VVITALGTAGLPVAREIFLVSGIGFGAVIFGLGVLSDLRAVLHPTGGIGIFVGTFNPFHNSHLRLVREAIEHRDLEKVIIHPTIIPWLHRRSLDNGEIRVKCIEDGYVVYEETEKADVNADYFPTGRKFLPPEVRRDLIQLAIDEAGLSGVVEVAYMPDVYERDGFFGVIREIKRAHPGTTIHGIHGSDFGGMHARLIMDECGWIYPVPFLRRDRISATAIRDGAAGMTSASVADALVRIAHADIQAASAGYGGPVETVLEKEGECRVQTV